MKEFINIATLPFDQVSEQLVDDLVAVYPEGERMGSQVDGKARRSFCVNELQTDDPRVEQILATLKRHGWFPKLDKSLPYQSKEFFILYTRQYSKQDIERSQYLCFGGKPMISNAVHDDREPPTFKLPAQTLVGRQLQAVGYAGWVFVSDYVRRLLEEHQLKHVQFRPTIPIEMSGSHRHNYTILDWSDLSEAWWEITSDLILPPLNLGQVEVLDSVSFEKYTDPVKQSPVIREGLFLVPELQYRRCDIEATPKFDLACVRERQGRPALDAWKVASQRFNRIFRDNNIKANWRPVRIEEGK